MYRDDLEAAIARAEAAERQLAEAREEIARLKAPPPKPPPKPPEPSRPKPARPDGKPSELRPLLLGVLGVAGVVGLTAAMIFGNRSCARDAVMNGPGQLDSAYVMRAADGAERLVLVSEAHTNHEDATSKWRIDVVDPATGKRLRREGAFASPRDHRPELAQAGPGTMWCDLRGNYTDRPELVEQCDVDTLAIVVSEDALRKRHPSLASGFVNSAEIDPATDALIATLGNGERIRLGPDLALAPFPSSERFPSLGRSQDGANGSLPRDLSWSGIDGGSRVALFRGSYQDARRIGQQTFIVPEVLAVPDHEYEPMILPDGGVIVFHQEVMDRNTSKVLVSHVGLDDGAARWTFTLPPCEVKLGARFGDTIVVAVRVFGDVASLVVAFDWKTGVERWRYEI